ncbi:MAG: hypothetical protein WCJ01_06210 [Ignavibacteria bacterium]
MGKLCLDDMSRTCRMGKKTLDDMSCTCRIGKKTFDDMSCTCRIGKKTFDDMSRTCRICHRNPFCLSVILQADQNKAILIFLIIAGYSYGYLSVNCCLEETISCFCSLFLPDIAGSDSVAGD